MLNITVSIKLKVGSKKNIIETCLGCKINNTQQIIHSHIGLSSINNQGNGAMTN